MNASPFPPQTDRLKRFNAATLRGELAPLPGRAQASLRMLIACLLIVTLAMALQIPNAALSAYMVFFVSREDMSTTAATGIALIAATTVAIGLTLLAYIVTIDAPPLRLALMTLLFCVGMYLSRAFVAGPLGFGLGFILLITQSTVDLYPSAEPLVRDTLWTWMALFFSIIVVVVVNMLLPARPLALLRQEACNRLASVIHAIDRHVAGQAAHDGAMDYMAYEPGGARLATLLKLSSTSLPQPMAQLPHYAAVLKTLGHLADAAAMLSTLQATPMTTSRSRLATIRLACTQLCNALKSADCPQPSTLPIWAKGSAESTDPITAEMEHHLSEIFRLWPISGKQGEAATDTAINAALIAAAQSERRLFVTDALSNPTHMQFALKSTFASMLCYVLYTAIAWPGIHTCVITCSVVALASSGATIHKAALRIAGALVGGTLALLATVFVVPHLESIGGLLLSIAPVVAASAWIANGNERSAYLGWQIAFAFFLCILHGYGPNTDVTIVRDRLVGILLGIAVMSVVFKYIWPERAERRMRTVLAQAVRASAALLQRTSAIDLAPMEFAERRGAILQDLADAERLARMAAFEEVGPEAELAASTRRAVICALQMAQPGMMDDAATTQLRRAVTIMLGHASDRLND
jgi:multidrug resistance protein MdtO